MTTSDNPSTLGEEIGFGLDNQREESGHTMGIVDDISCSWMKFFDVL